MEKNRVKNHGMGYSNVAAAKNKSKSKDEGTLGGKVTQYRSIDDIPNITGDETIQPNKYEYTQPSQSQPFSNRGSYYDDNSDEYNQEITPPQPIKNEFKEDRQNSYSKQMDVFSDYGPMLIQKQEESSEHFHEEDEANYSSDDDSSPSLPYPPKMKEEPTPHYVDSSKGRKIQQKGGIEYAKQSVVVNAAPPLPCDMKEKIEKQLTGKDKLYFSKEPRSVQFKPYTQGQYNMIKPKEYVEISNIKPDLNTEDLIAKRANVDRVKEFAKNLQQFNHEHLRTQKKLPPSNEKFEIEIAQKKQESKRQKAIEFAKNIPKPKVNKSKDQDKDNEGVNYDEDGGGQFQMGEGYEEDIKLQELEAKHVNSKKQIEAIRKAMGLH
mmetsp:Transcript_9617/g.13147  ORF Transcript_9617/g.13147 Transcript_9617/m.13147 type:complete len:378 (-) Transcript_9617:24-1157(-)